MESDDEQKAQAPAGEADTDAYYGEDDMDVKDLDLSFLDEEDDE
jgi:hypothetical protein